LKANSKSFRASRCAGEHEFLLFGASLRLTPLGLSRQIAPGDLVLLVQEEEPEEGRP
jgi:hypothetical protein